MGGIIHAEKLAKRSNATQSQRQNGGPLKTEALREGVRCSGGVGHLVVLHLKEAARLQRGDDAAQFVLGERRGASE